jgi:phage-related protein
VPATSVGYATLNIVPTAEGFGTALSGQMLPAAAAAGTKAGEEGGKGFGGSLLASVKSFIAPLAALFAADKIADFFKDAVTEASGLNEAVNALNVTFGPAAQGIMDLGKNAATSLGLSELQFDNLTVKFSNFAKNIAGPGGDVVKTMDDLTHRAADFASVYNIDVDQAVDLFSSSLAGLSRPIRQYGIDTSAATVAAYAYANGIAEQGAELTEAQRIQATYGVLMQQTAQVQGDFANTSDQLANSQRIAASEWADVKGKLGDLLLPTMRDVSVFGAQTFIPFVDRMVDGLTGLKDLFVNGDFTAQFGEAFNLSEDSATVAFLFDLRDAVTAVFDQFKSAGSGIFAEIGPAVQSAFGTIGPMLAGLAPQITQVVGLFNPLGLVIKAIAPLLPQIVTMLAQVVAELIQAAAPLLPVLSQVASLIVGTLAQAFVALMPAVSQIVSVLGSVLVTALNGLGPIVQTLGQMLVSWVTALAPLLPMLANLVVSLLPPIASLLLSIVGVVAQLFPVINQVLASLMPLLPVFASLIADLLPPLAQIIGIVIGVIEQLTPLIMELLQALLPIIPTILSLVAAFVPLLPPILSLITTLLPPLVQLFAAVLPPIMQLVAVVINALLPVINDLMSYLQGLIKFITGVFSGNWSQAWAGIKQMFSSVWDGIKDAIRGLNDILAAIPQAVLGVFSNAWNWLKDAGGDIINGLINGIKSKVSAAVQAVKDAVSDVINGAKHFLGIGSPSKVFRDEIGRWIPEGLAVGINANVGSAVDAAQGMADAIASVNYATAAPSFGAPSVDGGGLVAALAAAQPSVPDTLVIRDADGALIGRMRVEAGRVSNGTVTPLDEGRASW